MRPILRIKTSRQCWTGGEDFVEGDVVSLWDGGRFGGGLSERKYFIAVL